MTEIATRDSNGALPVFHPTVRQQSLLEWVETAKAVRQIAEGLALSSFVPAAFKGKPHEATAAILAGHEVGLDPIASLRAFDIIQGSAAPRAMTLRAIVQSKGHDIWPEEESDTRVVMCGQRKGSDKVQRSVWDIDRAKKLKLTSKDNWQQQPKAMLIARATAEVCRLTASDAIMGMPYSAEEMRDEAPRPIKATATRTPPKTIREAVEAQRPVVDTSTGEIVEGEVADDEYAKLDEAHAAEVDGRSPLAKAQAGGSGDGGG
jgi:hypothetical protein